MTDQAVTERGAAAPVEADPPPLPKPRIGLVPALTVFLSAFLLFQVQPLIGKFILPWFGGAPGVWTTCLLFFQVALLAGYAYAHLVVSRVPPHVQAILHVALLAAVLVALPIIPAERWKPTDPLNPTGRIIGLLALTVGLPYFALATTAPLLQAWVARIDPRVAPYRLYALSNFASLLALVSYPFLIEPLLSRRQQAWAWSGMFAAFAVGCAYCAWRASRAAPLPDAVADAADDAPPPARVRLLWIGLPACASAMLLGTSNTLTQDVAAVPFLWVLPLALYLLTFVLAFDHPRWYSRRVVGLMILGIGAAMLWAMYQPLAKIALWQILLVYSAGLFVACLMCHGELARLRPHPRWLTGYYLAMAAGGALGGAFVSILAPMLFTRYLELGLSVWASCALVLFIAATDRRSWLYGFRPQLAWFGLVAGMIVLAYAVWANEPRERGWDLLARMRNFYGVLRVFEASAEETAHIRLRKLAHGRTTHGVQAVNEHLRRRPMSYYGPRSGLAQALEQLKDRAGAGGAGGGTNVRIGVIGLGTGSIAALAAPGDGVRFYEIDPNVLHVARAWFTYLADSPATVDVILGDGRLSLEREAPQQFDLLVLDAFSSDAIPVHLLTKEAFAIYRRHVKPDGIFAVHISNQHLDLEPVIAGLAGAFDLRMNVITSDMKPGEGGEFPSTWVILEPRAGADGAVEPEHSGRAILWTDDSASLFGVMKRPGARHD